MGPGGISAWVWGVLVLPDSGHKTQGWGRGAGHLNMPKRGWKMLPLSEMVNALNVVRKINSMLRLLVSLVRRNLLSLKL